MKYHYLPRTNPDAPYRVYTNDGKYVASFRQEEDARAISTPACQFPTQPHDDDCTVGHEFSHIE